MSAVLGAAAHIVDRVAGAGGELRELPREGRREGTRRLPEAALLQRRGEEVLGLTGPYGVGAAEPMPVRTVRVSGCSAIPKAQTAMTMALRVPTLENCCGPSALGRCTERISSSGSMALRLTPV